ncbi:MAG: hypothetical protein JW878_07395 [Methanomicrobia archaeon]|nr:hypothetical protein [Methanomicrobia archaeon]
MKLYDTIESSLSPTLYVIHSGKGSQNRRDRTKQFESLNKSLTEILNSAPTNKFAIENGRKNTLLHTTGDLRALFIDRDLDSRIGLVFDVMLGYRACTINGFVNDDLFADMVSFVASIKTRLKEIHWSDTGTKEYRSIDGWGKKLTNATHLPLRDHNMNGVNTKLVVQYLDKRLDIVHLLETNRKKEKEGIEILKRWYTK